MKDSIDRKNNVVQKISLSVFLIVIVIAIFERIPIVIQLLPIIGIVCLLISVYYYLRSIKKEDNNDNENTQ